MVSWNEPKERRLDAWAFKTEQERHRKKGRKLYREKLKLTLGWHLSVPNPVCWPYSFVSHDIASPLLSTGHDAKEWSLVKVFLQQAGNSELSLSPAFPPCSYWVFCRYSGSERMNVGLVHIGECGHERPPLQS